MIFDFIFLIAVIHLVEGYKRDDKLMLCVCYGTGAMSLVQ